MVQVQYEFDMEGTLHADPFLDSFQLQAMFEQTRQSMERDLQRKLGDLSCKDHHEEPRIIIRATYDAEREELDMNYHVDTCCKLFMVQVIKTLNNVD